MPDILNRLSQAQTFSQNVPTLAPPSNPDPNDVRSLLPQMQNVPVTTTGPSPLQNFQQDFALGMARGGGPQAIVQNQLQRHLMMQQQLDQATQRAQMGTQLASQQFQNQLSLTREQRQAAAEQRLEQQGDIQIERDSKGNVWVFRKSKLLSGDIKGGAVQLSGSPWQPIDPTKALADVEAQWGTLAPEHKTILQSAIQDANEAKDITPLRQAEQFVAGQRRIESQASIAEKDRQQRAGEAASQRDQARLDNSYKTHTNLLEAIRKPLADRIDRLNRLQISVNERTPQADSLIAPELLTAMAGGQGSGLRMNEAEIARIVGGRTNWEGLKAALNKWQTDPSKGLSVTDAQRAQIQSLIGAMSSKTKAKADALDQAQSDITSATSVDEHRRIFQGVRKQLTQIDMGGEQPQTVKMKAPNGQVKDVPADQVEHYKKLGAVVVQ